MRVRMIAFVDGMPLQGVKEFNAIMKVKAKGNYYLSLFCFLWDTDF
jgi:hypothetical protein